MKSLDNREWSHLVKQQIKILLLDYQDSFSYNILSEYQILGLKVELIAYEHVGERLKELLASKLQVDESYLLIHGPGPGHPLEHQHLFPLITQTLQRLDIFHLGICLGHQILWHLQGERIVQDRNPVHGVSWDIELPKWKGIFEHDMNVSVQRYNSLFVAAKKNDQRFFFHQDKCLIGKMERGITYQFHPESIGTNKKYPFFAAPLKIIYNRRNEK